MKKKCLYLEWNSIGNLYMLEALKTLGYEVIREPFLREKINTRGDVQWTEKLVKRILEEKVSFVFTYNYFPIVAIACKACRVLYVSWTYDNPSIQLYSDTVKFETNLVFVFEKGTVAELKKLGCENVYYLPMAAPTEYYRMLLGSKSLGNKYKAEVSFVGALYSEDNKNPFRKLVGLKPEIQGYLDGLIAAQQKVYGYNFIQEILESNQGLIDAMMEIAPATLHPDSMETIEWVYANYFIARKVTAMDRRELLERMSHNFETHVYSNEKVRLGKVISRKKVDYYEEAPFVFEASKINLNITLRSIQTGIPLRAFDIMGCGGFLMSNYQEDYLDFFEPGRDIVLFASHEEAIELADYYLTHEEERRKIAINGYERVCKEHTYLDRLREIERVMN